MRLQQAIQPAPSRDQSANSSAAPAALPDINAETYPFPVVQQLLDQAAYFNLFSRPDTRCPGVALGTFVTIRQIHLTSRYQKQFHSVTKTKRCKHPRHGLASQ